MMSLQSLLKAMIDHGASDMHLSTGSPPAYRVNGLILRAKMQVLTAKDTKELCYSVLSDKQKAILEDCRQIDFSFGLQDTARFRANFFYQRGAIAAAFRFIPFQIPKLSSLGLPESVNQALNKTKGLVLVTGATGSGKSTTLASMIDAFNERENLHIVTIEDPIEYIHTHRNCLVNQREIGGDAQSFSSALRASLREDPDVVLVGEMRDRETIETALSLAETGHLVFSTLHTNGAHQTITRIVQAFPPEQQEQIRMQLSLVLECIISQVLLERMDGKGRAVACEIMYPNSSIRNLIRENKLHQIPTAMQTGQDSSGMITMNQSLAEIIRKQWISKELGFRHSPEPEELGKLIGQPYLKAM